MENFQDPFRDLERETMAAVDKRTAMEKLVGTSLLKQVGTKKKTAEILKGKELILLYFSASW